MPVFCWEQRTGWCFCGRAEFRILLLNGLGLSFPGIAPVAVSEWHQGQVTPGSLPLVLPRSAGWEGNAAVVPSCGSCSGCAGSVTLVWKVGGANL